MFSTKLRLVARQSALVCMTLGGSSIVLADSPLDCPEPVCDDKKEMFLSSMKGVKKNKKKSKNECPLNRSQLGRSTWDFLHTTAAYYPENPTEQDQIAAKNLIDSISQLYACSHCREHFKNHVDSHPPDVSSRTSFSKWLCNMHNVVNEVLDKPQFDCNLVEKRWRTGCRKTHKKEEESASDSLGQQE